MNASPERSGRSLALAGLALLLLGALVWMLPFRRAGHGGGPPAPEPTVAPSLFESAGVTEWTAGRRGPVFRLERFAGDPATLDTWKDKLVVLNFWATWCAPCTTEMPTLENLWRTYRERGLVVVGVSVDRGASHALLEPYLRRHGLTFPVLLDPDMETANAWHVPGIPTTFLIRPGGELAGMVIGYREWDSGAMRALLETLLPPARAPAGS